MEPFKESTLLGEVALELSLGFARCVDHVSLRLARPRLGAMFGEVRTFCVFLGHPRSGHSIVGSVLDAHPNAVVAHRLNAARLLADGYSLNDVLYLARENAQRFNRRGRKLTGYSYAIEGASQGKVTSLRLVGDQEGKKNAEVLRDEPSVLDALYASPHVTPKFLHVVRNPFDNITTMAIRACTSIDAATETYFHLCDAVASTRRRLGEGALLDVHHEAFVHDPKQSLQTITRFLGITAEPRYLEACARGAYPSAHASRTKRTWSTCQVDVVRRRAAAFPHLDAYTFV